MRHVIESQHPVPKTGTVPRYDSRLGTLDVDFRLCRRRCLTIWIQCNCASARPLRPCATWKGQWRQRVFALAYAVMAAMSQGYMRLRPCQSHLLGCVGLYGQAKKAHLVDALAAGGDEGRCSLR